MCFTGRLHIRVGVRRRLAWGGGAFLIDTIIICSFCQKLRGITDVPSQRITDLEAAIRQMRQLSCILDSCTISASYEVARRKKPMNTIFQPMKTFGKSTRAPESTTNLGSSPSEPLGHRAHRANTFRLSSGNYPKYDDWKSTTEQTLSAPCGLLVPLHHFSH